MTLCLLLLIPASAAEARSEPPGLRIHVLSNRADLLSAGESIATDTNTCSLKPLRRADYDPVAFTDAQWAQLEKAFPTGVCD